MPLKTLVNGRFCLLIVSLDRDEFPVFINVKFVLRLTDSIESRHTVWIGKERSGGTSYERTDQARVRDRTYSSTQAIPVLHRQVWHAHVWVE